MLVLVLVFMMVMGVSRILMSVIQTMIAGAFGIHKMAAVWWLVMAGGENG